MTLRIDTPARERALIAYSKLPWWKRMLPLHVPFQALNLTTVLVDGVGTVEYLSWTGMAILLGGMFWSGRKTGQGHKAIQKWEVRGLTNSATATQIYNSLTPGGQNLVRDVVLSIYKSDRIGSRRLPHNQIGEWLEVIQEVQRAEQAAMIAAEAENDPAISAKVWLETHKAPEPPVVEQKPETPAEGAAKALSAAHGGIWGTKDGKRYVRQQPSKQIVESLSKEKERRVAVEAATQARAEAYRQMKEVKEALKKERVEKEKMLRELQTKVSELEKRVKTHGRDIQTRYNYQNGLYEDTEIIETFDGREKIVYKVPRPRYIDAADVGCNWCGQWTRTPGGTCTDCLENEF